MSKILRNNWRFMGSRTISLNCMGLYFSTHGIVVFARTLEFVPISDVLADNLLSKDNEISSARVVVI